MKKMVLVLDESGAKGYAKTREKYEGEIGVMAGFMYSESDINVINNHLTFILRRYQTNPENKFHITDLDNQSQAELRKEIFDFISGARIRWFYQAIYAEGFHQSEFFNGRGGDEDGKKSLHATLFQNMFIMSLSIASSFGTELDLEVKTDHVDAGVLKKFEQIVKTTSDLFLRRDRELFKHVPADKPGIFKKEYWKVSTKCDNVPQLKEINVAIKCEYSPLTIMADILANSVRHYLDKVQKTNPCTFLNNKEVLKEHPIVHLALVPNNEEHIAPLSDIVYRRTKDEMVRLPVKTGNA